MSADGAALPRTGPTASSGPRPLRIALFTGAYDHIRDGVSLTLNRAVAYLEREGIPSLVFAPTTSRPALVHAGSRIALPSIPAPARSEYRVSLGLGRRARRALATFRPTLVHVATPDIAGVRALQWAGRTGRPVVASYHTHFASYLSYYGLSRAEPLVWRYLRWFYARCAHVYVPTASMEDVLRAHGIEGNLRRWPRGVDTRLFDPARRSQDWRRALGADDDVPVVLFVSRLVAEKGVHVLAEVLETLRRRAIEHRAVIVGDGPERAPLAARLPHVRFAGTLEGEALARAYASSDVFLFPSDTETFGNVTLEAMASGLPVVCADATGSTSLVRDGSTGVLVPPRDAGRFADAVAHLAGDPRRRREMGTAARDAALKHDWEATLAMLVDFYRELS